ncbi:MAG: leucine-rich repeat domain-containing protein [Ruminococcaceae bacterium]|nr:leucine-rich repeat domain-containing protein [Oscillospiraceae bacterium]
MKKRFLILLAALLCLVCALALTACEEEPTPAPVCQHRDADDNALCDKCNESYTDGIDIVTPPGGTDTPGGDTPATPEHTHSFGEWVETTAPTCTTKGVETRTCACGETKSRDVAIDPNAHTFGNWGTITPATCQAKGVETRTCACGADETRDVAKNMSNHVAWGQWGTITPATCQAKGVETRSCACGADETRDVSKNMSNHVAWGQWGITTPATCQAKGEETRSCACGADETRDVAKNMSNHVAWGQWGTTTPATCQAKGEETRTCTCGKTESRDVAINPNAHSFGNWNITTPATCQAKGVETRTCACGADETRDVLPTGAHVYDRKVKTAAYLASGASATAPATYYRSCVCGTKGSETFYDGYVLLFTPTSDYSFYVVTGIVGDFTEVEIPRLHDGLRVITIGTEAFRGNTDLEKIILPNTIQTIEDEAFMGCTALTAIELPTSVSYLGERAFKNCTALGEIVVPGSVTWIREETFANCTGLISAAVREGVQIIGISAFSYCTAMESVTVSEGLLTIDNMAFDNCKALRCFDMPDTVTTLGNMSFRHAEALQSVTFSEVLTTIGNAAFQYCVSLVNVELHAGITRIGNSAFSYCDGLQTLRILGNIQLWGNSAFYECQSLRAVYLASTLAGDMGGENYIFYNAGIAGAGITLTLAPEAVVPERLFEPFEHKNTPKLVAVVIEEGATAVRGFQSYNYLPYLTSVTYPDTVTEPNYGAWNGSPWWRAQALGKVYINGVFYGYKCHCNVAVPLAAVEENRVEPKCTVMGTYDMAIYCEVCGDELDRTHHTIPQLDHAPATTWTTDGTHHWKVCTRTGCTAQLSKTTHSYGNWVETLAPTCVAEGSHYKICTTCSHKVTEAIPIDASKHAPATAWEKDATGHWHKCTRTGCTAQVNKTTHTYGEWVETLAPTCVAEGSHYRDCTVCAYRQTEAIPIDASKHAPATAWEKDATGHWHKCTNNGCTVQLSKTTHSYGNWVETLAPTCVAEGSHYKTCTTCSHKVTEAIPIDASKHAPAADWTSDETGHWHKCTRTGCTVQLSKTTHTYGAWTETLAPTCVAEGSHYKTCTTCSHKVTEAIPIDASNHAPATTWTTDGTNHWKVCTRTGCGVQLSKTTHSYGNWVENLAPTCVAEGSHYKTCTTCSHKVTEAIPIDASKHAPATTWEKDAIGHWGSCSNSGCNYMHEKVPHTYNAQNICTVCAHAYVEIGLKFALSGGTYTVTDYTGTTTEVVIPATYKGVAVTSIGNSAFEDCSKLTSVTIPASVTSIGDDAFYYCSNLTAVYITDLAAWCNITFEYSYANPLWYAKNFYLNGQLVTALEIPSGITAIKSYAFNGCTGLTSITIPASVTSIGDYAFRGCSQLTSVTIPASVTSIGDSAFYNCTGLTAVYISDLAAWCNITFENFYANPLYDAENLYLNGQLVTALDIPSGVTAIKAYAFYDCDSLTSVTIPASVMSIGYKAFFYCFNLNAVYISDLAAWCNITFGDSYANPLYYAKNLYLNGQLVTALEIPSGITAIKSYAFNGCTGLTSITIPASVTSIGDYAFRGCSQLTSVTIPASVTSIGDSAFFYCYKLTTVTIPASVTSIGDEAFYNCISLTAVEFGTNSQLTGIGYRAFYYCSNLTSVTIPASVTSIGSSAFENCSNLTTVTFGANSQLTSIGNDAFCRCSLTSVTIPASVTSIGDDAFYGCSKLTTVEFGANSQLTSIGGGAFRFCSNLTSVTIPASVTSIGSSAFENCSNLTSVTIPASVTSIGRYAFCDCSKLTSVTFANPNGWWYASSDTATSGTAIPAADLSDASTAATYLRSTYEIYYWKRT